MVKGKTNRAANAMAAIDLRERLMILDLNE